MAGCGGSSESVPSATKPLETVRSTETSTAPASTEESTAPTSTERTTVPSHPGTPSIIVSGDPAKAIKEAVEAVLAPHPPNRASAAAACGFFVTERYLQTTYGGRRGCVDALVPGSAADSVKVSGTVVNGNQATARAVPSGGPSGGETIKVRLVRAGSVWKVDSLRSNAPVGP
jgi:hypothetical protein